MQAAAGVIFLFGDARPRGLQLRKISETATTITLSWAPQKNALGYRMSSEKQAGKVSHTWDAQFQADKRFPPCNTKFAKGSTWYRIETLLPGATDIYTGG
jgi:hypothetical protein